MEACLETIVQLGETRDSVRVTQLSKEHEVSKPSVLVQGPITSNTVSGIRISQESVISTKSSFFV